MKLFGSSERSAGLIASDNSDECRTGSTSGKCLDDCVSRARARQSKPSSSASRSSLSPGTACTETYLVAGPLRHRSRGDELSRATCVRGSLASLFRCASHPRRTAERLRLRARPADWIEAWTDAKLYKRVRPHQGRDRVHRVTGRRARRDCSMSRADESTMSKTIEEILAPKPEARPRIYAYSIADEAHEGSAQGRPDDARREAARRRAAQDRRHQELHDRAGRVRRARRRHDLHRPRGARGARQEGLREHRAGVDALLGQGREDRAHRAAHRPAVHRHASRDVPDAPRAGRGREQDARLLPLASGRRTCTPSRASCGTRRCASARPSPPISSPRSSAPSACSW